MPYTLSNLLDTYSPAMERLVENALLRFAPDADIHGMIRQIVQEKGKRIRPALVLASHLGFGGDGFTSVPLAAAVELIHNASLIHDDIEDMDAFRRNHPSAWKRFGVPQALNLGDFLLPCAMQLVLGSRVNDKVIRRLQDRLCREMMCLVHSQMLEIRELKGKTPDMQTYRHICAGKTGALFRLCLTGGAELLGDETTSFLEDLDEMGSRLGLLFQMRDDWIDITGQKEGRDALGDLMEGKISLVSVLALDLPSPSRERFFDWYLAPRFDKNAEQAREIRDLLIEGGVLHDTREVIREQLVEFRELSAHLAPAGLMDFINNLLERLFPPDFLESWQ